MKYLFFLVHSLSLVTAQAQLEKQALHITPALVAYQPLQLLSVSANKNTIVKVFDGKGRQYVLLPPGKEKFFTVAGALGKQIIKVYTASNTLKDSVQFTVTAKTQVNDGGYYTGMFSLFYNGMFEEAKMNYYDIIWNKTKYSLFVPWVLDNYHTMKGKKYFLPNGGQLVDVMRQAQREDGMIYSFIQYMNDASYFLTRDKKSGYSKMIGDKVFVRQPVENHPEYLYVNTIYEEWKSSGNHVWMKAQLASAQKALDYCLKDPARWSNRFGLLKRAYTIDSWDFAAEDEYLPKLGMTNSMIIDPVQTKFGIFFGDNTGYITACYQLAEMLLFSGNKTDAAAISTRAGELSSRINKLAWNGNFFTHFIDEDSTVKRNLGVNEKTQIAQSNAYSTTRAITPAQQKAIVQTYLNLKNNLPAGSPGEWYSIYPPFQTGFESHNEIWQYMNGGVGGHVAGELARGAYECGYENYGTDILNRLYELGKKHGNKIWFAYTGAETPVPPAPVFKPINLAAYANMDITVTPGSGTAGWMNNKEAGNDISSFPTGKQLFNNIAFDIVNPATNQRNAVVGLSNQKDFPSAIEISVNDTAACVYLLHTSGKPESEGVAASMQYLYEDGTMARRYLIMEKHLTYWWFSDLATDYSGIAWRGKNPSSEGIGISWCAINNPHRNKKIAKLIFQSYETNAVYALLGVTLADKLHTLPVKATSYGGPDDWAAATAMAAFIEGLVGVKENKGSVAYSNPLVAPRWLTTSSDTVNAVIKYAASESYVAYNYVHDKTRRQFKLQVTGNGNKISYHLLLPAQVKKPVSVTVNNKLVVFSLNTTSGAVYADFESNAAGVQEIIVQY